MVVDTQLSSLLLSLLGHDDGVAANDDGDDAVEYIDVVVVVEDNVDEHQQAHSQFVSSCDNTCKFHSRSQNKLPRWSSLVQMMMDCQEPSAVVVMLMKIRRIVTGKQIGRAHV